ncbi:MAG: hypothetical protein KIG31_05400 [Oscillospiraceae bacterium]|nr:hypothetical protein [Oscillospiraceae bacterium]
MKFSACAESEMKEIPHRRSDFTRRRRISLAKQISQNPQGIYFVEKKHLLSVEKRCFFSGGEGGICFSAEKPRRLQQSPGLLLRAAFQIPPTVNA